MKLRALCLAAAMVMGGAPAPVMAWDWTLLGSRDVRDTVDRDVIHVEGDRRFERIRLCASERPVHILDVNAHYANGATQDVSVRARLRPGECTRAIDLVGEDRNLRSVEMVYEANTRRRGVHASVRLFGE